MKKLILISTFTLGTYTLLAQLNSSENQNAFASVVKLQTSEITSPPVETMQLKTDALPSFLIGIRFMPTVSSFGINKESSSTIEVNSVLSYGYGGLIGVNLSNHVGLQAEVIYSALAQKFKDQEGDNQVKLNYINIPLLLVLNTDYSAPVNLNFVIGPQFGINTGSSLQTGSSGEGTDTVHAVLAVKTGDVGFAYGAGLDFGFGSTMSTRLSLGFRGVYGLIDISDQSQSITTNEFYVLDRAHVKTYSGYIGLTFTF